MSDPWKVPEIKAAQAPIGAGLVDIGPISFGGRRGVLIRPRTSHIPLGEPGELQGEEYWPTPGDIVLWLDGPPDVLVEALTGAGALGVVAAPHDSNAEACIACSVPFKDGDEFLPDIGGGFIHMDCCGPEPESFVDLETGEQLSEKPTARIWSEA